MVGADFSEKPTTFPSTAKPRGGFSTRISDPRVMVCHVARLAPWRFMEIVCVSSRKGWPLAFLPLIVTGTATSRRVLRRRSRPLVSGEGEGATSGAGAASWSGTSGLSEEFCGDFKSFLTKSMESLSALSSVLYITYYFNINRVIYA